MRIIWKKKILLPAAYFILFVVALAFQLDALMMMISAPMGLIMIGIHIYLGYQITSIWVDVSASVAILFLIGCIIDEVQSRIRKTL
ncbi:MAG: hypothetical protein QM785_06515 [Pyrinomonadaceae bacterium]